MKVSVIVVSVDGPKKIRHLLTSLKKQVYKKFELLIGYNGNGYTSVIEKFKENENINFLKFDIKNNSAIKNKLTSVASGDIIAFSDDDCIADKLWIKNAVKLFQKYTKVSMVFGTTLPYEPTKNRGKECPCTITHKKISFFSKINNHSKKIGFGNNMFLRKKVLLELGGFFEYLGPGSSGKSGEDAELILRLFNKRYLLATCPNAIIYHNKWLGRRKSEKLYIEYLFGGLVTYGIYLLMGEKSAFRIIIAQISDYLQFLKNSGGINKFINKANIYYLFLVIFTVVRSVFYLVPTYVMYRKRFS